MSDDFSGIEGDDQRWLGLRRTGREAELERALLGITKELADANRMIAGLTLGVSLLPSADPPPSDHQEAGERSVVDQTIDALDKRIVGQPDRVRLRGALDKADAPLTGRPASDEAVGRITRLAALQR